MTIVTRLILTVGFLCSATLLLAEDAWRGGEFRGTVILSVSGNLTNATRAASDEEFDKFFIYNNITFDTAAQYDYSALAALPQVTVSADFPMGGPLVSFEGPTLETVLKSAGATGETVTLTALDGYAIDAPLQELIAMGAVVALKRDGIPFAIGDFGPTQLVFPRAERDELAEMNDDWWIWSIYHIRVE